MIRVAVWGTGMMGQGLLGYILDRPKDIELVGVIDRHPEKHGRTGYAPGFEIKYVTEEGRHLKETFDLVVLPEGLESPADAALLARAAEVDLNPYDFCKTHPFGPLETSRPGIYVAGAFQEFADGIRSTRRQLAEERGN
jgi:hypothetical protein